LTLDKNALQRMFEMIGSDDQVMAELVQSFLDETPLLVDKMLSSSQICDHTALGLAAHTLKSTARDFGAEPLANLCQALETMCQNSYPTDAETQINAIVQLLKLSQIELKTYGKKVAGGV
jgi:histidine phosphotransfer protein HptB